MVRRCSLRSAALIVVGVLSSLSVTNASAEDDLARHLDDQYKDKTFILRSFYSGNHLKYDASGHVLTLAEPGDWTIAGVVHVESLRVSGDRLRIDARRLHLGWPGDGFQELHDQAGKVDKDEKEDRSLRIEADLGSSSMEAGDAMLSQIFLTSKDNFADLVPDYWKPCVRVAVAGKGGKDYASCRLSPEFAAIPGVVSAAERTESEPAKTGDAAPHEDALFRPGHGVTPPRAINQQQPSFSEEARRAKYQGTLVLALVVDATGQVRNVHVARPLGMGLDRKAVETVSSWQFKPSEKEGQPVAAEIAVEVDFHLY